MPTPTRAGLPRLLSRGLSGARGVVDYLRAVVGADAYDRYCAHLATHHPDREPPSEKQFWREHMDWLEKHPQGRCC
ncbi:YbdD/YjiX family protein [Intrasporangium sp.]|uniref:YbdD/YjiX family protein n=1 Tax=Intrasporangium sp. TaxID=1925024 RepID=UPI002939C5F3|nr:YbdD/YjiX family protein [Intrasporangium sp.]MDV3219929.1 YbdD/YjiX family protein [Intrasporangium sp.]